MIEAGLHMVAPELEAPRPGAQAGEDGELTACRLARAWRAPGPPATLEDWMKDLAMLDDVVEIDAFDKREESGTVATASLAAVALCACGSGLAAKVCCSLDLRGQQPVEPTPENQTRLEALLEARRSADQPTATALCLAILGEQPTHLEALAQLFLIRKSQDNHPAAPGLDPRASTLAPQDVRFAKYLVDELIVDKAWGQAETAARRAVRLKPDDPLAHAMLGQVFTALHRHVEGEHHPAPSPGAGGGTWAGLASPARWRPTCPGPVRRGAGAL